VELGVVAGGRVGRRVSAQLGPLKLMGMKGGRKGRRVHIKKVLERITAEIGPQRDRLFLVGGSWRAIAKIDMYRRNYPLKVLHEYRMSRDAVRKTCALIAGMDPEELRSAAGISSSRMALVPHAAEVLSLLVRRISPKDIAVSSYGIREGLLYEQMPQRLRDRDPLIEAARFAEAKDARLPGYGRRLYTFLQPLFRNLPDHRQRLIKAACLLHDVSWRAHPDYRAEICFDNATRANLGGLKHAERVFLGLALMYRYSSKQDGTRIDPLLGMLTDRDLRDAEVLGRAMRFGAMLWTDGAEAGRLRWRPKRRELELHLTDAAGPLYGEVAAARLQGLASALEADLLVTIAGTKLPQT